MKNKIIFNLLLKIHSYYWKIIDFSWKLFSKNKGSLNTNNEFSIGIVTYIDRYNIFFKSLISNFVTNFPNTEFIIVVNGYFDSEKQNEYLIEITNFLDNFNNVKLITYNEPQSLSKLWNQIVLNSKNEKTFIFNDDIKISRLFQYFLNKSNIINEDIALINRSWSHFLISKSIINLVGWFDERFPAVGNEDEDYECRLIKNNISIKSYKISGIKNIVFITKNFSYGKNVESINVKYIKENKIFFDKKWELKETKEEGYDYVRILDKYVKLKNGMETPNFYFESFK